MSQLRVVCAWCTSVLTEGAAPTPVSHSICSRCTQLYFPEETFMTTVQDRLERLGFVLQGTGGNCTAYVREDGDTEELITLPGEPKAPDAESDFVDVSFWENGEERDVTTGYTLGEVLAALEYPSDEYYLTSLRLHNNFHKAVVRG